MTISTGLLIQYSTIQYNTVQYNTIHTHSQRRLNADYIPPSYRGMGWGYSAPPPLLGLQCFWACLLHCSQALVTPCRILNLCPLHLPVAARPERKAPQLAILSWAMVHYCYVFIRVVRKGRLRVLFRARHTGRSAFRTNIGQHHGGPGLWYRIQGRDANIRTAYAHLNNQSFNSLSQKGGIEASNVDEKTRKDPLKIS